MPVQWLVCDNGEKMWVNQVNEYRIKGSKADSAILDDMVNIPLRSDDILLNSYAKTGCHWLWENVRMLLNGVITRDNVEKDEIMMEFVGRDILDEFPSPRVLNNHCFFKEQPSDLLKGKNKVLFIYRNPKDTCVSYYHHCRKFKSFQYDGKFSNFLVRFAQGKLPNNSYWDYLKSWEEGFKSHPNIEYHLMRYEDLHQNPISERRRLASFLGREYDDAFLQEVTDATSIDTMRKLKDFPGRIDAEGKPIMYRKGKVGDWKDNFTVSESEWFDSVVEKEMKDSKLFKFVYSVD